MGVNKINPYPNRILPVGNLEYQVIDTYGISKVRSMLEYGEKEFIYDIPRICGEGNYCNLGDSLGGSAILLSLGLEKFGYNGVVYTIDNYKRRLASKAKLNYKRHNVEDKIVQLTMTTDEAVQRFSDQFFKFIFIDADHQYESVKKDFLNYYPLIRKGGIIAFHDCNQERINKVIEEYVNINSNLKWEFWVNRIKAYRVI